MLVVFDMRVSPPHTYTHTRTVRSDDWREPGPEQPPLLSMASLFPLQSRLRCQPRARSAHAVTSRRPTVQGELGVAVRERQALCERLVQTFMCFYPYPKRNEQRMWSESRSPYGEMNPRGRFHPGRGQPVGSTEYQRPITVIHRRRVYDRGGGRGTNCDYNYYRSDEYNHSVDYRDYSGYSGENRGSTHGRPSGPPPKTGSWDDENGRWFRGEHSRNRPLDYRDNLKRNHYHPSHHMRDRSPQKRENPYYRACLAPRKVSPHSRSGSSISSRSYSPEKSKALPSHHSQYSKNKERSSISSLTPSRDASPSSSTVASKNASFEKASKSSDNLNKEIVNDWSEKQQIPELEISEHSESFDGVQKQHSEKLDGVEMNTRSSIDLIDLTQADNRTRAIAEKTKEIEEVYRQDCETFGLVVQMLIDKDPTLEKTMQFALRENLREIGERCIEELRTFITHHDFVPGEHTENL